MGRVKCLKVHSGRELLKRSRFRGHYRCVFVLHFIANVSIAGRTGKEAHLCRGNPSSSDLSFKIPVKHFDIAHHRRYKRISTGLLRSLSDKSMNDFFCWDSNCLIALLKP